jgi:hypothetical protein
MRQTGTEEAMVAIEILIGELSAGANERRLTLVPTTRLEALEQPGTEAYAIIDEHHPDRALFGLACDPRVPIRLAAADALRGQDIAGSLELIAVGRAPLGPGDTKRLLVIYPYPDGARLVTPATGQPVQIEERAIFPAVVGPVATTLIEWEKRGLCHGAVRPDNLFMPGSGDKGALLGDGLSSPCGAWQPTVYEPISRARATPVGRGQIDGSADIYALGVTAAALLKGATPGENLDHAALMRELSGRGAVATLAGFVDPQSSIGVALEGMLHETPEKRWSATEVVRWVKDRVRPPDLGGQRSMRRHGFTFLGEEHRTPKSLAMALATDPDKASQVLRKGEVTDWLRKTAGEKRLADALEAVVSPNNPDYSGRRLETPELVSRASIVLDAEAPILYRGTAVRPDGIGPALAEAEAKDDKETIDDLMSILKYGVAEFWIDQQTSPPAALAEFAATLKSARVHAKRKAPGFGIRRALYDLNPSLPCQAPLIRDALILDVDDVLPTLQDRVASNPPNGRLIDRHLAGFIASKLEIAESRNVVGLGAPNIETDKIWRSTIWLLGTLHSRSDGRRYKSFAKWLTGRLSPVLDELHNRTDRKTIVDTIAEIAVDGNLSAMATALLDEKLWRADAQSFAGARQRMASLRDQIATLTEDKAYRDRESRTLGNQFALAASYALLGFTLIFVAGTILS